MGGKEGRNGWKRGRGGLDGEREEGEKKGDNYFASLEDVKPLFDDTYINLHL